MQKLVKAYELTYRKMKYMTAAMDKTGPYPSILAKNLCDANGGDSLSSIEYFWLRICLPYAGHFLDRLEAQKRLFYFRKFTCGLYFSSKKNLKTNIFQKKQ